MNVVLSFVRRVSKQPENDEDCQTHLENLLSPDYTLQ